MRRRPWLRAVPVLLGLKAGEKEMGATVFFVFLRYSARHQQQRRGFEWMVLRVCVCNCRHKPSTDASTPFDTCAFPQLHIDWSNLSSAAWALGGSSSPSCATFAGMHPCTV